MFGNFQPPARSPRKIVALHAVRQLGYADEFFARVKLGFWVVGVAALVIQHTDTGPVRDMRAVIVGELSATV